MHLLLFHEDAQSGPPGEVTPHREVVDGADIEDMPRAAAPTPTLSHAHTNSLIGSKVGTVRSTISRVPSRILDFPGSQGMSGTRQHSSQSGSAASGRSLRASSHTTPPFSNHASSESSRTTETSIGKTGRFATAGRVREFKMTLQAAAAHASKMKVYGAQQGLRYLFSVVFSVA